MGSESSKVRRKNDHLDLLAGEVAEIRGILGDRAPRLESLIHEARASATTEGRRFGEIRESLEATVFALENRLQEKEEMLERERSAIKELEQNLNDKIPELENALKEKERVLPIRDLELQSIKSEMEALVVPPQNMITLREEDAVTIKELEEEAGITGLSEADKREEASDDKHLATEVQRLRAEVKEKDVLLEARAMEVKIVKQSMEKRIRELEKDIKRQAGEKEKKSRLVSFIGTIEKKN